MTYIYQTSFDLRSEDTDQLRIGKSVATSLAWLKAFLPGEPGFVNARAMVSMVQNDNSHVIFETGWDDWEALEIHLKNSAYAEQKMLKNFELDVQPIDLTTAIYEEVG